MNKYIVEKIKNKNAQALPEFALCLPLILLIIGMIVSLGQMTYCKQVLQAAAEVGCRVYVDGQYATDSSAARKAAIAAQAIVDSAGFGIEFERIAPPEMHELGVDRGETAGHSFKYVLYRVEGKFATLFPLEWQGKALLDSSGYTHLYGSMIMLYERID